MSVFVHLWHAGRLYTTLEGPSSDEIGVPGGKREPTDANLFTALCREFLEETGAPFPFAEANLAYVEWGSDGHMIRVYVAEIDAASARALPVGESPDRYIQTLAWRSPNAAFATMRYPARIALRMHETVRGTWGSREVSARAPAACTIEALRAVVAGAAAPANAACPPAPALSARRRRRRRARRGASTGSSTPLAPLSPALRVDNAFAVLATLTHGAN